MENTLEWIQVAFHLFHMVLYIVYMCCIYATVLAIIWGYTHMLLICGCLGLAYCFYRVVLFLRARHRYLSDPTGLKSPG